MSLETLKVECNLHSNTQSTSSSAVLLKCAQQVKNISSIHKHIK